MRWIASVAFCAAAASAASADDTAFAAGFAGAYARAVLLDQRDAVTGCRANAPLDANRAVWIERRVDSPPTISLTSDLIFDIDEIPGRLLVGGRPVPVDGRRVGASYFMRLDGAATREIIAGADVVIDYGDLAVSLPRDGLADALAFAEACRFG